MQRSVVVTRVFNDAFTHTKREIQPPMSGVPLLEVLHNPQCMQVVVEAAAVTPKAAIKRSLARMPKRRMPDVVYQRQRLGQVFVQSQ